VIVESTRVPFKAGDTIASVTLRLLAEKGMGASYQGSEYGGFYLESISGGLINGSLGEFDAGRDSGWMITWNGWFINQGASQFEVKDGDSISWQYTCQLGADIGDTDWGNADSGNNAGNSKPNEDNKPNNSAGTDVGTSSGNEGTDGETEKVFAFADVKTTDWFYNDVQYVANAGLFNGTSAYTFSPQNTMTRGMLVTVLYRLAGQPAVYGTSPFADVQAGQYYTNAVVWAQNSDIVNGVGNGKFNPDDNVTREQMAVILYRYAQYMGYKTAAANTLTGYGDFGKISVYALQALKWANAEGLINGYANGTLVPQGTATRAEVAAMLHRFVDNVVNG